LSGIGTRCPPDPAMRFHLTMMFVVVAVSLAMHAMASA
jgi:hypothetical protein